MDNYDYNHDFIPLADSQLRNRKIFSDEEVNRVLKTRPHYLHDQKSYKGGKTLFGVKENDLIYNNTELLYAYDIDKWNDSCDFADKSGAISETQRWYEIFLGNYLDRPISLRHIFATIGGRGVHNVYLGYILLEIDPIMSYSSLSIKRMMYLE